MTSQTLAPASESSRGSSSPPSSRRGFSSASSVVPWSSWKLAGSALSGKDISAEKEREARIFVGWTPRAASLRGMDRVLILDNGAHSIKALHPTKGANAKCVLFPPFRRSLTLARIASRATRSAPPRSPNATTSAPSSSSAPITPTSSSVSPLKRSSPLPHLPSAPDTYPRHNRGFSTTGRRKRPSGTISSAKTHSTFVLRSSPAPFRSFRDAQIDTASTQLLITEPVFNLPNVQDAYDQILFEEYNFASCLRSPGPALVPYGQASTSATPLAKRAPECVLVVDSGYSFTQVVPVLRGAIISSGVRRYVTSFLITLLAVDDG